MKNLDKIKMTPSSGNVFDDLDITNAQVYQTKAELAHQINILIQKKKFTQKQAAALLDVDQPKISALATGRLSGFSIDRLLKFLTKLNQDIKIVITPHRIQNKISDFPYIQVTHSNVHATEIGAV